MTAKPLSIHRLFFYFLATANLLSCKHPSHTLFEDLTKTTGVVFNNQVEYTEEYNPYTYRSFFNGGGVALGDINNDGLLDIYFAGNLVDNVLYLNKGDWEFEDITKSAGVACPEVWSSGATFVDVNGDGLLDLYVCKSGKPGGSNRHNELFINNGDLSFSERSQAYGLDIVGLSTHAAFFDYDKDGDLDCYVLTNSLKSIGAFDLIKDQRNIPDPNNGGNKFLRNDGGIFKDVTLASGIYSSAIGFGLGITLSDFNRDGWTDLYISNDFFERDYLYINNKGIGFKECLESYFKSISMGSMGADAADLNNDNEPDLFVTEMMPSGIVRRRTKALYENWDKYEMNVQSGYFHQYPRNVLQRKISDSLFVEVGRYAGVSATDWSWGALIFDADNDGLRDIFVANGIYKDLLDRDYLTYTANNEQVKSLMKERGKAIEELIDAMPSEAVPNQMFTNKGDFVFENVTQQWGFSQPTFSNGSAYGDLDNDGDLDLVVNNVNMPSTVYRNNTDTSTNRSIRLKLVGTAGNTSGIGARVTVFRNGRSLVSENFPYKGFQSSIEHTVHFGVGNTAEADSIWVKWERGGLSKIVNAPTNERIVLSELDAENSFDSQVLGDSSFFKTSKIPLDFRHVENRHNDFDRDRLLPHMLHNEGSCLASGDIDGDGLNELFIGGAKNQPGAIFTYGKNGFMPMEQLTISKDSLSEDVDAVFFDADNDGDQDLYVASGGRAFSKSSSALRDRLYLNDGKGLFVKSTELNFPEYFSTGNVSLIDYDSNGDIDLLVTERYHPFRYGDMVRGYLMENNGSGKFSDVTPDRIPQLLQSSMITGADVGDVDGDGDLDILLAHDWGNLTIYYNDQGNFKKAGDQAGLSKYTGWWNDVKYVDYDEDGDLDIIAGNHGLNSFFKDTTRLYINDFDRNGTNDYLFCEKMNGKYYTVSDKNDLIAQLPSLKKKLLYYKDYASMAIGDLFSEEEMASSRVLDAVHQSTTLFENNQGRFEPVALPSPEGMCSSSKASRKRRGTVWGARVR